MTEQESAGQEKASNLALLVLLLGFLVCFVGLLGTATKEQRDRRPHQASTPPSASVQQYRASDFRVVSQKRSEGRTWAKLEVKVLTDKSAAESEIRAYLSAKYKELICLTGYENHRHPNYVILQVYNSAERIPWEQWTAELRKRHDENRPTIKVKSDVLLADHVGPVTRGGMSEARRREIWRDIIKAGDRATLEAEERFPMRKGEVIDSLSNDAYIRRTGQNIELEEALRGKYKKEVAHSHGITMEQLDAISAEGIEKDWPIGPPLFNLDGTRYSK